MREMELPELRAKIRGSKHLLEGTMDDLETLLSKLSNKVEEQLRPVLEEEFPKCEFHFSTDSGRIKVQIKVPTEEWWGTEYHICGGFHQLVREKCREMKLDYPGEVIATVTG